MKNKYIKYEKIIKKINKICSKLNISCQQDISYNDDLHLQFRRILKTNKITYNYERTDYAECYIKANEIRNKTTHYILKNIKGFLHISFNNKTVKEV